MTDSPLRVIVIARNNSSRLQTGRDEVLTELQETPGIEVVDVNTSEDELGIQTNADLALVLGGDGAILRACRLFGESQLPILGINLGRLGFLADLSPRNFLDLLPKLAARDYQVVSHLMFECLHEHADGQIDRHLGLNETAILSGASLQLIDIDLAINGERVTTYSGDGLLISTPVGSTAHNLSAGGPILRQDLHAFAVTPICPHTLTIRPLIDDADSEYTLSSPSAPSGVMLVVDGQVKVPFKPGDTVTVRRAAVTFQLIRFPGHSFYGTLHRKLGWQGQPKYQHPRRDDEGEGEDAQ